MNKFVSKAVLVGGDPFTKEEKFCQPPIKGGKETCSDGDGYGAALPCAPAGRRAGNVVSRSQACSAPGRSGSQTLASLADPRPCSAGQAPTGSFRPARSPPMTTARRPAASGTRRVPRPCGGR